MKICIEGGVDKRELQYEELKIGDVFGWEWRNQPRVAVKTSGGYTHIAGDMSGICNPGSGDEAKRSTLVRYPNACLTLGDPE